MILHSLFDSPASGDAALAALRNAGIEITPEIHRDQLGHNPHAGQSAVAVWFAVGGTVLGAGLAWLGFLLGSAGMLGLPVPPETAMSFFGLAGFSLGGLASALGGSGAFQSHYVRASRDMQPGQVLLTLRLPWSEGAQAQALLEQNGALSITQVAG